MELHKREVMNEQKFRVLKVYRAELGKATDNDSCCCDSCLATPIYGYYIAVLNSWFCPKCFNHWLKNAVRYKEDIPIEEKNYQFYRNLLGFH